MQDVYCRKLTTSRQQVSHTLLTGFHDHCIDSAVQIQLQSVVAKHCAIRMQLYVKIVRLKLRGCCMCICVPKLEIIQDMDWYYLTRYTLLTELVKLSTDQYFERYLHLPLIDSIEVLKMVADVRAARLTSMKCVDTNPLPVTSSLAMYRLLLGFE